jgi:hypothetical protein
MPDEHGIVSREQQHDDGAADSHEEPEPCPMAGLTATPFRGRMPRVDRRRRWARRCPTERR